MPSEIPVVVSKKLLRNSIEPERYGAVIFFTLAEGFLCAVIEILTQPSCEHNLTSGLVCGGAGPLRLRIFAWFMARCGKKADKYLGSYKSRLFSDLAGTVLEIGPGAGANLSYFPRTTVTWIGVEPNPYMTRHLRKEARQVGMEVELRLGAAENLPASDASVDFVISTLVLCSAVDQARALEEVLRVLKPGGKFLFIEHVAAKPGTCLHRIQALVKPIWHRMGDGCQPDRETRAALEQAGFAALEIEEFAAPIPIVRPHIAGVAVKGGPAPPNGIIG